MRESVAKNKRLVEINGSGSVCGDKGIGDVSGLASGLRPTPLPPQMLTGILNYFINLFFAPEMEMYVWSGKGAINGMLAFKYKM